MKIAHRRNELGMTQENLAEKLNVERSAVAKWETGQAMPRTDKLPLLAKVLKCEIKDLFD